MKIRSFGIVVLVVIFTAVTATMRKASAEGDAIRLFKAGAAASNITPPLDEPIVGGWGSPPGEHIHDELYARCLVLDDGRTKLVFVVADSLGMTREVFDIAKRTIHEKTKIPVENMLMGTTHTHSSISARGSGYASTGENFSDYQSFVIRRIADGVRRALNNLEPARIGWGRAEEPTQVFNRRYLRASTIVTTTLTSSTVKRISCMISVPRRPR